MLRYNILRSSFFSCQLNKFPFASSTFYKLGKRSLSTTTFDPYVYFKDKGVSRTITLNRPEAHNAYNFDMIQSLYSILKEWENVDEAGLVIIKGAGDKAFCAGGDVLSLIKSAKSDGKIHKDCFREEYTLIHLVGTYPLTYVALIDGITMGGGCGLSINGDFRVATENTLMAMPETALGFFPDVGASYFLPRLPGKLGMFLALTSHRLKGADVFHAKLATHYVQSRDIHEMEFVLQKIPKNECTKENIDKIISEYTPEKIPEFSLQSEMETINTTFDGGSVEEIIEKLKTNGNNFCQKTLDALNKMSPTSLKVTFEQLKKGSTMDFHSVFTMEHRMGHHFLKGHDFYEGCRAILIDKDRNPKWNPSKLEDVSEEEVKKYFEHVEGVEDLILSQDFRGPSPVFPSSYYHQTKKTDL